MSESEASEPSEASPAPDPAPWGIKGAVLVIALSFAVQIVAALILGGFAAAVLTFMDPGLIHDEEEFRNLVVLVSVIPMAFIYTVFTLALVYVSITRIWRRPFAESLNLRIPTGTGLAGSLALGIAMAIAFVVLSSLYPPAEDLGGPLARLAETGLAGHLMWILLAVVMAPAVEEVLFRGFAYLGIRQKLGPLRAGIAVSGVFLLLHLGETGFYFPALVGIGAMAVILTVLMERGRNLTYCIACHLGYNGALSALSFIAGGE